jgi:hypothetical protein
LIVVIDVRRKTARIPVMFRRFPGGLLVAQFGSRDARGSTRGGDTMTTRRLFLWSAATVAAGSGTLLIDPGVMDAQLRPRPMGDPVVRELRRQLTAGI